MNQKTRNTTIAGVFTVAVLVIGFVGFSGSLFNSADIAVEKTQDSSQLAVKQVTQSANASSHCSGSYGRSFGSTSTCYRSGKTTYTVVLASSTSSGPVNAQCDVSPQSTSVGSSTTYDGSGSTASSGIASYEWDFGDGNTDTTTGATTNHTYSATGTYAGSLKVTSANGNSATTSCPQVSVSSSGNSCPTVKPDSYSTPSNTAKTVLAPGVLGNDTDPDGDSLESYQVTSPSKGTLTSGLNTDGSFTYDPYASTTGTDTFTYEASDGSCSVEGDVEITIDNQAPSASDHNFEMTVDEELDESVTVTDPDDSSFNFTIVDDVDHGNLNMLSDGSFEYEPNNNYFDGDNSDYFIYKAADGSGGADQGRVEFDIYNNKPAAEFSGPNEIDYCQVSNMMYDAASSSDDVINNGTVSRVDGDAPDKINDYQWNMSPSRPANIIGPQGSKLELNGPIEYEDPTDIDLQVEDDEGELSTTETQTVEVVVPEYQANIKIPDDPKRLWITASSTNRSTKSTIKVTNINLPSEEFDPDYSFSDLKLELFATGTDPAIWEKTRSTSTQEFTFWADPDPGQELAFGTYTVKARVVLPLSGGCVYDKEKVTIPLRAQTTAEF